MKLMTLLEAVIEDRVQLKAGGLFPVRMELTPTVIGAIATYLVILMQSSIGIRQQQ